MDKWMQFAIDEAKAAQASGDEPFGAVLVRGEELMGVGRNHMNTHDDPISHAEIECLRAAGLQESYEGTVLYASAVPCIMCAGAIVWLKTPEVIAGASWDGSELSRAFMVSHGVKVTVLELEEAKELLRK